MRYEVPEEMTLIEAMGILAPDSSKSTLRSWLKEKRVTLDGKSVKVGSTLVAPGQVVEIESKKKMIPGKIEILYEDRDLVVVNKPAGLLSVAAAFETVHTVHGFLKKKYRPKKVHVVHRLDQETSGVMLFALSEAGWEGLKKMFEEHVMERRYCAVVEGHLDEPKGTWQSHLYEDKNYVVHTTNDPLRGRLAITHYSVVAASRRYTRLDLRLETGRKNQIRVHCQGAGVPVVGDKKYGAESNPLNRLGLHAYLIAFAHPVTGKAMRFEAPIPKRFLAQTGE